ncbi:TerD family protein [Nakamurella flavida]|uniref:TerD family protein n=1 Tax=Nakamurella flavida TaxID=363630 RepID=A0A938YJD1_9ACTN|nr:TerD family protein [Nakamurella flavida]MBM9476199.1 TerD family protein [Nakamurella flavida]MDP9777056.1 stress response protein SCP2 [Nakamurella flavida]
MTKGQNLPIEADIGQLQVAVRWSATPPAGDVDLIALLVGADGRARSDDDMVFYNQRSTPDGSVVHTGKVIGDGHGADEVSIDLREVPQDVTAVVIAASTDGAFADLPGIEWRVRTADGDPLVVYPVRDLSTERALVLGEVYRRDGHWRLRAVGQGWAGGLAGLATDYGISVGEAEPDAHDDGGTDTHDHPDMTAEEPGTEETAAAPILTGDASIAPSDRDPGTAVQTHPVATPATDVDSDTRADSAGDTDRPDTADTADIADPRSTATVTVETSVTETSIPLAGQPITVRTTSNRLTVTGSSAPRARVPVSVLAGNDSWRRARLFSVAGIGGADEQENRATAALMWVMGAVRPFGRAITARAGAPAGAMETFLETPFVLGEAKVIPDGVIRVARGRTTWTALLEVKTGSNDLNLDQITSYLRVARREKFDVLLTVSNEVTSDPDTHPVLVPPKFTESVRLVHLSWSEVMHELRMLLAHHRFTEQLPMWILAELLRYLEHPKSGAMAFSDMSPSWVPVRDGVAQRTLAAGDRHTAPVVAGWHRLVRQLCLRLTTRTGKPVKRALPRKLLADPVLLDEDAARRLADDGVLTAVLRIPGAVGTVAVTADVRTTQVRLSLDVLAPTEGTPVKRVQWLVRQLRTAPDDLTVEALFAPPTEGTREHLGDLRDKPARLIADPAQAPRSFRVKRLYPLGTKRSGATGSVVASVTAAVDDFYDEVVLRLTPWAPQETSPGPADDPAPDLDGNATGD